MMMTILGPKGRSEIYSIFVRLNEKVFKINIIESSVSCLLSHSPVQKINKTHTQFSPDGPFEIHFIVLPFIILS